MPNTVNKFETFLAGPAGCQGLYCVWMRAQETQGAPLIAVWIDPQMRAMEQDVNNFGESAVSPAFAVKSDGDGPYDDDGPPGRLQAGMARFRVSFPTTIFTRQQQSAGKLERFLNEDRT